MTGTQTKNKRTFAPQEETEARFPEEVKQIAAIQAKYKFKEEEAIEWAIKKGLIRKGSVVCAEVSPTHRCPESCPGCPDSSLVLARLIKEGKATAKEDRVELDVLKKRMDLFNSLGVFHYMVIGGTVDHMPTLQPMIEHLLGYGKDIRVSWFTDGIPLTEEATGKPSALLIKFVAQKWIHKVATHISSDYPFEVGDLIQGETHELPSKVKRSLIYRGGDWEYSRWFKSHYGAMAAKNLINLKVRRVVLNTTISDMNLELVPALYQQAVDLANYAKEIGSPTEVLWTFSPWIWRPHQARGGEPKYNPPTNGIQTKNVKQMNKIMMDILMDTYKRIEKNEPRILANSSGYTSLHAIDDPEYNRIAIEQDVGFPGGRPVMYKLPPNGVVRCDVMGDIYGPELRIMRSTFGYMDREPRGDMNPFTQFQLDGYEYFSNIIPL
jgi:hypothetical protein